MITAKINKSKVSISAKIEEAKKELEPEIKGRLYDIAGDLVSLSPVWSGAYVTSHSFVPKGSGAGRMRKSNYEAGPADVGSMKNYAFDLLAADIASVNFMESEGGTFRNRSEHARVVEDGGTIPNTSTVIPAYNVYRVAAGRANSRGKT